MFKCLIVLLFFFALSLSGSEHFISWNDDIAINEDGSLTVDEKIKVKTEGIHFRRGMWRTFPTRYTTLGFQYVAGFTVKQVTRDGRIEPYSLVDRINGKQIYIGNTQRYLPAGIYTYLISYKTDGQLGFFDDHDELYYNIIGTDVGSPIDRVTARICLPQSIPRDAIKFEAYTGYAAQKGRNYRAQLLDDGTVFFETKHSLRPWQAFTIVVTWPKGYIAEPTLIQTIVKYAQDNVPFMLLLFGSIVLLLYYLYAYRKTRLGVKQGPIIPLFHPPRDMYPGAMRYMMRKGYDASALTSDIVNMAVKGFLTITYKTGTFLGGTYSLATKEPPDSSAGDGYYLSIYDRLNRNGPVALTQAHNKIVRAVSKQAQHEYAYSMDKYIKFNRGYSGIAFLLSLTFLGLTWFFSHAYIMGPFMVWVALYVLISMGLHIYYYHYLPTYTAEGQKLHDEIEGFKLFLSTTETDRLKVIGTPPTKTPKLWEKYLPYAIALGVEQKWSKQFAPVFARLEQEGTPYKPIWYVGPGRFSALDASRFSSELGQSFNTAIASASTPPGSHSGSGGRGSAGGGGGGGGAGGW